MAIQRIFQELNRAWKEKKKHLALNLKKSKNKTFAITKKNNHHFFLFFFLSVCFSVSYFFLSQNNISASNFLEVRYDMSLVCFFCLNKLQI